MSDLIYVDAPVAPIHVCWVMRVSQQHLCQKLPKSVYVHWSYSVQNWCRFFETQCILYEVGCELLTQSVYLRVLFLLSGLNTECLVFFLFIVTGGSRGWLVTPHDTAAYFVLLLCMWLNSKTLQISFSCKPRPPQCSLASLAHPTLKNPRSATDCTGCPRKEIIKLCSSSSSVQLLI